MNKRRGWIIRSMNVVSVTFTFFYCLLCSFWYDGIEIFFCYSYGWHVSFCIVNFRLDEEADCQGTNRTIIKCQSSLLPFLKLDSFHVIFNENIKPSIEQTKKREKKSIFFHFLLPSKWKWNKSVIFFCHVYISLQPT